MATGFKSGGRPPGGKNKATLARQRAIREVAEAANGTLSHFSGDAWALLASVYKCNELPIEIRIEAAKAAIAYERPRLAPVPAPEPAEPVEAKALRLHELLRQMRETIGGDRTNWHTLT